MDSQPSGTHQAIAEVGALAHSQCNRANEEYEAFELIDDWTALAICESNGKAAVFDLRSRAVVRTFRYLLTSGLQPSDAARLHLGIRGALVLERKYVGGARGKSVHIRVGHLTEQQLQKMKQVRSKRTLISLTSFSN